MEWVGTKDDVAIEEQSFVVSHVSCTYKNIIEKFPQNDPILSYTNFRADLKSWQLDIFYSKGITTEVEKTQTLMI